jgi:hypothetical protein
MALVDDQQVGGRQFHPVTADGARMQRRDARHLHRLERPRLDTGVDDAVHDPGSMQL